MVTFSNDGSAIRQGGRTLSTTDCADFFPVENLETLLDQNSAHPQRIMHHDAEASVAMTPGGLFRGVNLFGPGNAPVMLLTPQSVSRVRSAFSFALDRGILLPTSTAIVTHDEKLVGVSIENANYWGGIEHKESAIVRVGEELRAAWEPSTIDYIDQIAVSPMGIAYENYGHFLFDGLPAAYLLMNAAGRRRNGMIMATPPLNPWQKEVFALLNLDQFVRVVDRPARFKTLISNSFLCKHVSYSTRYTRPMFDAMRFAVPYAPSAPERIFITRGKRPNRGIRNLDAVEERLAKRGYAIVQPENYSVRQQIEMFSRARIIVGQTGAALANICFAPLGAKILELMPDCYPDQWTRSMSFLFGHRWHVYFCKVDEEDKRGARPGAAFHPNADFSFDVPLDDLEEALTAVESQ